VTIPYPSFVMRSAAAIAFLACTSVSTARAQDGFSLDRLRPPPSADDGLAIQRPETLGPSRFSARIVFDYAHAPLVVDTRNGGEREEIGAIVLHRIVARALAAYGLGDIAEVHLSFPLTIAQSGDESIADVGLTAPSSFALSDPAIGGSIRLTGDPDTGGLRLGVSASLLLPIGDDEALSGDGGVGFGADLLAAYALDTVTPVAVLGFGYRPSRDFANASLGPELRFGAGVHIVPAETARVIFELHGASAFDFDSTGTALELAAGVQIRVAGVVLDAGLGLGLTSAPGTPDFRAIIGLGYAPPRASSDVLVGSEDPDADEVLGDADRCPFDAEDRDGDADADGCPDPDPVAPVAPAPAVRFTDTHIEPTSPILFAAGSTDLDDAGRETLRAVAAALRADASIVFVQVEGYASDEGNRRRALSLSERRAVTVQRFLVSEGVAEDRLGAVGNGTAQPLSPTDHPRNRRVELRIVERTPAP
jgi:outer membrane protein OmpA-like peptidoglycan-associated protein